MESGIPETALTLCATGMWVTIATAATRSTPATPATGTATATPGTAATGTDTATPGTMAMGTGTAIPGTMAKEMEMFAKRMELTLCDGLPDGRSRRGHGTAL